MFHDIQALLDMLQRSHTFHILILFLNIRDKEDLQSFRIGSPVQAIYLQK